VETRERGTSDIKDSQRLRSMKQMNDHQRASVSADHQKSFGEADSIGEIY
jgi:hypothetical protein